MRIEVEFSSAFEGSCSSLRLPVELEEDGPTVKGLFHRLCELNGEKIKPFLFEKGEGSILSGLMVMVNDRVFTGTAINQQDVELHDRDKVSLLYFVSGG